MTEDVCIITERHIMLR